MTLRRCLFVWVIAAKVFAALAIFSTASAEDHQSTCRYFSNQAFQDRRSGFDTTFPMELAQDCVDAMIYARSSNVEVRSRAMAYLKLLESYRQVIAKMMIHRVRSPDTQHGLENRRRYLGPALASVSHSGAYLIARDMGVADTHEDWTSWRQSLVMADPRLRVE